MVLSQREPGTHTHIHAPQAATQSHTRTHIGAELVIACKQHTLFRQRCLRTHILSFQKHRKHLFLSHRASHTHAPLRSFPHALSLFSSRLSSRFCSQGFPGALQTAVERDGKPFPGEIPRQYTLTARSVPSLPSLL